MGFFSRVNAVLQSALGAPINLHPRETQFRTAVLNAAGSEFTLPCDGCSSGSLQLQGAFTGTFEVAGTIDGSNWYPIALNPYNQASLNPAVSVTTAGLWTFKCGPFDGLRVRATAFSAGAPTVTMIADNGLLDDWAFADGPNLVTAVGAAGAGVTLTIPAPGVGLRNKLTYLSINRYAAAALTAAGTPITVPTSGFPGSMAFTIGTDALALGVLSPWREDVAFPIPATAQNTAMSIIMPATPNVIWRAAAGFKIGQ